MRDGAPFHLNKFISLRRYNHLTSAIRYTDKAPPDFVDRFHDVSQMIDAFNQHDTEEYIPSWFSCCDKSVNSQLDQFCPGFMSAPQKRHPLENKYHSIADGNDGKPVMWIVKIQEEKVVQRMQQGTNAAGGCKFSKTTTLMCEMTEPIHGTGKIVSMDSRLCVTAGIFHLHDFGVYGQSLTNKHKYWLKDVPVEQINWYFDGKELGFSKTLKQDMDGIPFYVNCAKDTKFVTKIMSTHGLLMLVLDHMTYC
ncbi:hypothetical protein ACHAW6_003691 [Cyclotella cf. meneghiniana]